MRLLTFIDRLEEESTCIVILRMRQSVDVHCDLEGEARIHPASSSSRGSVERIAAMQQRRLADIDFVTLAELRVSVSGAREKVRRCKRSVRCHLGLRTLGVNCQVDDSQQRKAYPHYSAPWALSPDGLACQLSVSGEDPLS